MGEECRIISGKTGRSAGMVGQELPSFGFGFTLPPRRNPLHEGLTRSPPFGEHLDRPRLWSMASSLFRHRREIACGFQGQDCYEQTNHDYCSA